MEVWIWKYGYGSMDMEVWIWNNAEWSRVGIPHPNMYLAYL